MKTQISYDRTMSDSYMRIESVNVDEFDEKLLLLKKYPGILPMKKSFQDNKGEYWYNISGMQSLDVYSNFREIDLKFIEKIILSICSEVEILEKNLIDFNCLILEPETIFINNMNEEIIFTANPSKQSVVSDAVSEVIEYLLAKIDHSNKQIVDKAYSLYEKSIESGSSLKDLKEIIITERNQFSEIVEKKDEKEIDQVIPNSEDVYEGNDYEHELDAKSTIWDFILKRLKRNKNEIKEFVINPDEEIAYEEPEIHPTVCLTNYIDSPRGFLRYEGREYYSDLDIQKDSVVIGTGVGIDFEIMKETISHFHAKITKEMDDYYIEDLNSTNGTWVNGNSLAYKEKRKLEINDEIRFADVKYRFS